MQCFVYRSTKKDGLYVYLAEKDRLDILPVELMTQMGMPELALTFELSPTRSLSTEDPAEVLDNLKTRGFHVQLPPKEETLL